MLNILHLRNIHFWNRDILFVIVLFLLAACNSLSEKSQSYISKQEAIDTALDVASTSAPEISGPQEELSNIQAEKMTLEQAVKKLNKNDQPAVGYDTNMIVWLVTMDGLWLGEMLAPGNTHEPVPYRHYAIIIDAKTGSQIQAALLP